MTNQTQLSPSIRRSEDRGHANHGWLESYHSFSFANYQDPAHQQFRHLRVINEDWIAPGQGFGMHPHRSMEIFTYVVSGQLRHEDSMGNARTIQAGEFQYMSAGEGVMHSEFNASDTEPVHLLQIWIIPEQAGGEPNYADIDLSAEFADGKLTRLASPNGANGSIAMRQKADIQFGRLAAGQSLTSAERPGQTHQWLQLIKGSLKIGDSQLNRGDALSITHGDLEIEATSDAEFLIFQLS